MVDVSLPWNTGSERSCVCRKYALECRIDSTSNALNVDMLYVYPTSLSFLSGSHGMPSVCPYLSPDQLCNR